MPMDNISAHICLLRRRDERNHFPLLLCLITIDKQLMNIEPDTDQEEINVMVRALDINGIFRRSYVLRVEQNVLSFRNKLIPLH